MRGTGDEDVAALLDTLADIIPAIARGISPDCEVVLHDNRIKPQRVLAIGNGHVTDRKVGDLMTKIAIGGREMGDLTEPLFNYRSMAPNGRQLRVTLVPIRLRDRTVAYVAINFMIDNLEAAQKMLSQLTNMEPHPAAIRETFQLKQTSLSQTFDECFADVAKPAAQLSRAERIDLVSRLDKRGFFQIRGATKELALRFGVSRAAVYEYINVCKSAG